MKPRMRKRCYQCHGTKIGAVSSLEQTEVLKYIAQTHSKRESAVIRTNLASRSLRCSSFLTSSLSLATVPKNPSSLVRNRCYCELNFRSEVIAVKLRRQHIVVVLKQNIYVYTFKNLKVLCLIETAKNPKGLCCVSHTETKAVLACPGLHPGQVQIHDIRRNIVRLIKAHDSDISCMSLTLDGALLVTASTKGTLIRIFNTLDGSLLQEFRRGMERAEIYSVAISSNLKWVATSSEKETLHVFRLRPDILNVPASPLSFIRGILPKYFYDSERSFAQYSLPVSTKFIVGFGSENTVVLVGIDGSFRRFRFDGEGGKMVELEHKHFFSLPQTDDTTTVVL